jgi:hypothetical protein
VTQRQEYQRLSARMQSNGFAQSYTLKQRQGKEMLCAHRFGSGIVQPRQSSASHKDARACLIDELRWHSTAMRINGIVV